MVWHVSLTKAQNNVRTAQQAYAQAESDRAGDNHH
jgi:hypothetical protein